MPINPEGVGDIADAIYGQDEIKTSKKPAIPPEPFKEGRDYLPKKTKNKSAQLDMTYDIDKEDLADTLDSLAMGALDIDWRLLTDIAGIIKHQSKERAYYILKKNPNLYEDLSTFPFIISSREHKTISLAESVIMQLETLAEGFKEGQETEEKEIEPLSEYKDKFKFGQVRKKNYGEWELLGTPDDVPDSFYADVSTRCLETINIAPAELVRRFGRSYYKSEVRTVGAYVFRHIPTDKPITLYAYKATSEYDQPNPTPDEFFEWEDPYSFSVGGNDSAVGKKFKDWLEGGATDDIKYKDKFKFGQEEDALVGEFQGANFKQKLTELGLVIVEKIGTSDRIYVRRREDDKAYGIWGWNIAEGISQGETVNLGAKDWGIHVLGEIERVYLMPFEPVKKEPPFKEKFKFGEYKFKLPKKVWKGIKTVKQMGITNMFDVRRVKRILRDFNYPEAAEWVTKHPNKYTRVIMEGSNAFILSQG